MTDLPPPTPLRLRLALNADRARAAVLLLPAADARGPPAVVRSAILAAARNRLRLSAAAVKKARLFRAADGAEILRPG
ncbi:hypothetical protein HK405_002117, partial [Cladochytrium tenue]